jgi:hypothetical protein
VCCCDRHAPALQARDGGAPRELCTRVAPPPLRFRRGEGGARARRQHVQLRAAS